MDETHAWPPERAGADLASFPGIDGRWATEEIADLGRGLLDLGLRAGDA